MSIVANDQRLGGEGQIGWHTGAVRDLQEPETHVVQEVDLDLFAHVIHNPRLLGFHVGDLLGQGLDEVDGVILADALAQIDQVLAESSPHLGVALGALVSVHQFERVPIRVDTGQLTQGFSEAELTVPVLSHQVVCDGCLPGAVGPEESDARFHAPKCSTRDVGCATPSLVVYCASTGPNPQNS